MVELPRWGTVIVSASLMISPFSATAAGRPAAAWSARDHGPRARDRSSTRAGDRPLDSPASRPTAHLAGPSANGPGLQAFRDHAVAGSLRPPKAAETAGRTTDGPGSRPGRQPCSPDRFVLGLADLGRRGAGGLGSVGHLVAVLEDRELVLTGRGGAEPEDARLGIQRAGDVRLRQAAVNGPPGEGSGAAEVVQRATALVRIRRVHGPDVAAPVDLELVGAAADEPLLELPERDAGPRGGILGPGRRSRAGDADLRQTGGGVDRPHRSAGRHVGHPGLLGHAVLGGAEDVAGADVRRLADPAAATGMVDLGE